MHEGQEVGNYILEARIGKGGMGEVFRGRHKSLGTPAAIKVISAASNEDPETRERFSREARTQARLRHPNIAQVLDHVEHGGRWYLIIEYLPAGTLREVLQKAAGPVELERAVAWTKQSLAGLEYAHRQNVIHRDVKPANLLLDERGEVSVTDFGLAIMLGDHRLTSTGLAIGSPQYMSPEQINGGEIDHRTDIYSMGAVFFELLTGQVPFPLKSTFEMYRILVKDAPEPTSLNPAIPAALNGVVSRALAKDPRERYENCIAFSDAIDHSLSEQQAAVVAPLPINLEAEPPILDTQPAAGTDTPPPPPASNNPERVVIAFLILLFLFGTGAVGYAFYAWSSSRPDSKVAAITTDTSGRDLADPDLREAAGSLTTTASRPSPAAVAGHVGSSADAPSSTSSIAAASRLAQFPTSAAQASEAIHSDGVPSTDFEGSRPQEQLEQPEEWPDPPTAIDTDSPPPKVADASPSTAARTEAVKSADITKTSLPTVQTSPEPKHDSMVPSGPPTEPVFAVVATGDPLLARPLETELESRFRTSGLEVWDERSSLVIFDLLSGGRAVTPGLLVPELERVGVSVLVLADVEVVGYRDLYYYGRHSVATKASVHFNAFDLHTAMAIGSGWKEDIEYTELTADTKAGESLRTQTRDLLAELSSSAGHY